MLGAVLSPPSEPSAHLGTAQGRAQLTLVGEGTGGAPGEPREGVGMTGATSGVWAGVPGSLLLISPPDAEADPEGPAVPPDADDVGVRVGCKTPAWVRGSQEGTSPGMVLPLPPSVTPRFPFPSGETWGVVTVGTP